MLCYVILYYTTLHYTRAKSAKSTLLTSAWCPWDLFRSLRSVHMLKREWGAENNGKLPHLFIPSKTAALVPEFALKHMPFGNTL